MGCDLRATWGDFGCVCVFLFPRDAGSSQVPAFLAVGLYVPVCRSVASDAPKLDPVDPVEASERRSPGRGDADDRGGRRACGLGGTAAEPNTRAVTAGRDAVHFTRKTQTGVS